MARKPVWDAAQTAPEGRALLERLAQRMYAGAMDTKRNEELERRKEIVGFWGRHGGAAALEAFGVSRRTLFRWKRDPVPGSRARTGGQARRQAPPGMEAEILRQRGEHPRLGKEKLLAPLGAWCLARGLPAPSESTVGRYLADMREGGRLRAAGTLRMSAATGRLLEKAPPAKKEKLRRAGYLPLLPGDLLQVDGVTTFALGVRRYTFTAVDVRGRWAYARTYSSASSRNGADFLRRLLAAAPFAVLRVQTDNGGEFAKEFPAACAAAGTVQFFNWVRQPKYQGWVERFNRTIQEGFLDWRHASLAGCLDAFAPELDAWLSWYNGERVHRSLRDPAGRRLAPLAYLALAGECQKG